MTMMLVVSGVGTLIHIYAIGYMHEDVRHNGDPSRYRRFFVFMNLFIAMMMILVSSDNYLMLFVGWEGVGLVLLPADSFPGTTKARAALAIHWQPRRLSSPTVSVTLASCWQGSPCS